MKAFPCFYSKSKHAINLDLILEHAHQTYVHNHPEKLVPSKPMLLFYCAIPDILVAFSSENLQPMAVWQASHAHPMHINHLNPIMVNTFCFIKGIWGSLSPPSQSHNLHLMRKLVDSFTFEIINKIKLVVLPLS